jgi:hypothetical protein
MYVPLLRINSSTALLCCFVKTNQQAARECLPSFSHLRKVNQNPYYIIMEAIVLTF